MSYITFEHLSNDARLQTEQEAHTGLEIAFEANAAHQAQLEGLRAVAIDDSAEPGDPGTLHEELTAMAAVYIGKGALGSIAPLILVPSTQQEKMHSPLQHVLISKGSLLDYFSTSGRSDEASINIAGRVWGRLLQSDRLPIYDRDGEPFPLVHRHYEEKEQGRIRLYDLVRLVEYYDEQKKRDSTAPDHVILGRVWGPTIVDALKEFVAHAAAAQTDSQD